MEALATVSGRGVHKGFSIFLSSERLLLGPAIAIRRDLAVMKEGWMGPLALNAVL
jgi:hypothetical protein